MDVFLLKFKRKSQDEESPNFPTAIRIRPPVVLTIRNS